MKKMNGLYRAGFILALCCVPCALGAMAAGYLLEKIRLAMLIGGLGALCALVGIILTYYSKPKPDDKIETDLDIEEQA